MYKALDPYLTTDTWHTGHPYDDARFFKGLREIIAEPGFNADMMGEYTRTKLGVDRDEPEHESFNRAIDHRVIQADAIREFNYGQG